ICARVSHANVVPTLDVIETPDELALVMEYVHGASLETLLDLAIARGEPVPLNVAAGLMLGVLHGLSAAHEVRNDAGEPLGIVHRDVSPQNILVGVDGIPRVLDFGIAKARGRLRTTPSGEIKGKLLYMAPEQLRSGEIDLRVDLYGTACVLWEVLTGRTLFAAANESAIIHRVLYDVVAPPSQLRAGVGPGLDAVVLRGLARDPAERFDSAQAMIGALESELRAASQSEVRAWVNGLAGDQLRARADWLKELQGTAERRLGAGAATEASGVVTQLDLSAEANPADPSSWRSVGEATRVRARKTGPWLWWTLAGLALLGTLIGLLWPRSEPKLVQPPSTPGADPAQTAAVPAPPGAQVGEPVMALDAAATEDWKAPEPAPPSTPTPEERASKPAGARPASKPKRDCREPYVIDAMGVKRWKRECL
ncbi:MAG TPA: protein kinase, partial [Polyangiales bacterium]